MKKTPEYYSSITLSGVIDPKDLKKLLVEKGQTEWCSPVRIGGLMMLIDYGLRHQKNGSFSMSHDLARSYTSKIARRSKPEAIAEPLLLLCAIGILERVSRGVNCHIKASAKYGFSPCYSRRGEVDVFLSPKCLAKRQNAGARNDIRLNRKFPFRQQLERDLGAVSFPEQARFEISRQLRDKDLRQTLISIIEAIDGQAHSVRINSRGQITTSISSTLRSLKKRLLLHGEETVQCDISHCHACFLPCLLDGRIKHLESQGMNAQFLRGERLRLIDFLSEGDFYRKLCSEPSSDRERESVKREFNKLLNSRKEIVERRPLFQRFRRLFPGVCGVIKNVNEKDHRNLSKLLQRWTSDVINASLMRLQREGVPAIPFVDSIMVRMSHKKMCCEIVGEEMFNLTEGVRCKVDGERYQGGGIEPSRSFTSESHAATA